MEDTAESKDPTDITHLEAGTLNVSEYFNKEQPTVEENIQSFANLEQVDIDDMMASKWLKNIRGIKKYKNL